MLLKCCQIFLKFARCSLFSTEFCVAANYSRDTAAIMDVRQFLWWPMIASSFALQPTTLSVCRERPLSVIPTCDSRSHRPTHRRNPSFHFWASWKCLKSEQDFRQLRRSAQAFPSSYIVPLLFHLFSIELLNNRKKCCIWRVLYLHILKYLVDNNHWCHGVPDLRTLREHTRKWIV